MTPSLTSVPGVQVGHWSDPVALTGCTVIDLPEPNVVAVEVRGAAPGSRETALLEPGMRVEQAQAIVLAGGSAFGLAAADGVMRALERDGRGHPTPGGLVPIVPAAVIFDLMVGDGSVRPGADEGERAWARRSTEPVIEGPVGAGTGATVAKWRGTPMRGGLGSWAVERAGSVVGALAVVNSLGDVFTLEGEPLTGGDPVPGPPRIPLTPAQNTTLLVVATDAALSRPELTRLAVRAQDGMAATIRPAHTRFDGDICFTVSCGVVAADVDLMAEAAFEVAGRAIERAIRR
jgi:L-aminopeptidase/D-esterase-like protein